MTFSFSVTGKVLKNQVTAMKRSFFSYKETCQLMGHGKNLLLIEPKGPAVLSCMIHDVNLTEFCLKKSGHKGNILRGRIDKVEKQVVCERGNAVNLKISCSDKKLKMCQSDTKKVCTSLRPIFANQLVLSHHSKLKNGKYDSINCYFVKDSDPNDLKLNL